MAVRIKSQWYREENQRSMKEIAGAIAFNGWRIALDKAITLHGENFVYEDDAQRLAVIAEYLHFEIQLVDRLVNQDPAALLIPGTPPGVHGIILRAPPAQDSERPQNGLADLALIYGLFHTLHRLVAAALADDGQLDTGLISRLYHAVAVLNPEGHRLFDQHVHAMLGGHDGQISVAGVGRTNTHGLHCRIA
jgi:hypothetical protein